MNTLSIKDRFRLSRFFAGEKPSDEAIRLNQRRIFILPSKRGLSFVVLILLLLLIAFVYNNNLAYFLTFLLASVFFIGILHSYKALAGLIIQKGQCKPVFAGERAVFKIHIDNPTPVPRFSLEIALHDKTQLTLEPYEKKTAGLYAPTEHRGYQTCGTITLSSAYPLGLFRAWSPLRFNLSVLVYPKPWPQEIPFPETGGGSSDQGKTEKGTDDFYGLQEYQRGDSIKRIHWKAYAKGQGLFSKQYSGEQGDELWLQYEACAGYGNEERLSRLCRWVLDAEKAGLRYGLKLPGKKIGLGIGSAHLTQCLEALALF